MVIVLLLLLWLGILLILCRIFTECLLIQRLIRGWFLLLVVVSVLIVLIQCTAPKSKYPSGRDTYERFGNGRFCLFRQSGTILFADNENQEEFTVMNVTCHKEVKSKIYLIAGNSSSFHLVDILIPSIKSYSELLEIPDDDRRVFKSMMP